MRSLSRWDWSTCLSRSPGLGDVLGVDVDGVDRRQRPQQPVLVKLGRPVLQRADEGQLAAQDLLKEVPEQLAGSKNLRSVFLGFIALGNMPGMRSSIAVTSRECVYTSAGSRPLAS